MTDPQPSLTRIALNGAATVRGMGHLHADLVAALRQHAEVVVDCSAATEVDLSLIQLLLAARHTAQHADKTLRLAGTDNPALCTALRCGGFVPDEPDAGRPDAAFWAGTAATP